MQDAGFVQTTGAKPYQRNNYTVASAGGAVVITDFVRVNDDLTYSETTPYANPADGRIWYYSNPVDVDIMINDNGWKGYQNVTSDVRGYNLGNTDSNGVIISPVAPTSNSMGGNLKKGDLWLDSSDLENYPRIYRYDNVSGMGQWNLLDNSDQTSENGILFADARWGSSGAIDPVNDPVDPIAITCSPSDPDFFMKARPSYVFSASSPKSSEDVSGILPGTELRRSLRYWFDMCLYWVYILFTGAM